MYVYVIIRYGKASGRIYAQMLILVISRQVGLQLFLNTFKTSLALQWLGLRAFMAEDRSVPGRGTKILQAMSKTKKRKNKKPIVK